MPRKFSLHPFNRDSLSENFKLSGTFLRKSNELSISFSVTGQMDRIIVPARNEKPRREMRLWEETCFEFFLAPMESSQYWEFNLSPSGNWNVFRFISYREGMFEEEAFSSLPFSCEKRPGKLKFDIQVKLDRIIPQKTSFKAGISAVLRSAEEVISYWALAHPGPEADFHNPEGFLLRL